MSSNSFKFKINEWHLSYSVKQFVNMKKEIIFIKGFLFIYLNFTCLVLLPSVETYTFAISA